MLARLREAQSPARVLILTARGQVEDECERIEGRRGRLSGETFLDGRTNCAGRRARAAGLQPDAADILKVADLQMDVQHRRVTPRRQKLFALSPREFDVLQVLMQEPGRVFSRTELCERIWRRDHEYDTAPG